jgi:uncharacterized membrane protein
MKQFIKTTLLGGVLYLVPLCLVILVASKALGFIVQLVRPIVEALELHEAFGVNVARALAVLVLLLACFLAGLFARTDIARRMMTWLETSILSMLPGYGFLANLGDDLSGAHRRDGTKPEVVLARIEDSWQLALLVERIDEQNAAVYVPGSPSPQSGAVYLMTMDRLRPLDIPFGQASKCLKAMGVGARALLGGKPLPAWE